MLIAAVLVLLSACKIRVEVATEVERNGSGRVGVTLALALDEDERRLFEGAPDGDVVDVLAEEVPQGWESEPYRVTDREGRELEGIRATRRFGSLDELHQVIGQAQELSAEGAAADAGALLGEFTIRQEGDRFVFHAAPVGPDPAAGLGLPEAGSEVDEFGQALAEAFGGLLEVEAEAAIRVRLPGEVLESNADREEGGALVWELVAGERRELSAVSDASRGGDGGFPVVPVAVGVAAAVVLAGAFALSRRSAT